VQSTPRGEGGPAILGPACPAAPGGRTR
jgi:hypothetical protein